MASARTKFIGTATTLTLTAILIWISFNQNFKLEASGDITCLGTPEYSELFKDYISDCQVFWNVTSINYTYYFRNKKGIELSFVPEVKDYKWYAKDGRYKSGWRPLDKSGNFTFRKGIKYQFMAFIFKEPEQTIKWSITAAEVSRDPILFGVNFTILKNCLTTIITTEKTTYVKENVYLNQTYCIDYPLNLSCTKIPAYNFTREVIGSKYIDYQNITDCEPYGVQVNEKKILWKKYGYKTCSRDKSIVCCEAEHQSDGNGICEQGEGYVQFDLKTLSFGKNTISKTRAVKELMIE